MKNDDGIKQVIDLDDMQGNVNHYVKTQHNF